MQPMTGQVKRSGQVIADGVRGMYEIEVKRDGTENWTGYFIVPADVKVKFRDQLELDLTDGRSKVVGVKRVNVAPMQTTVSFVAPFQWGEDFKSDSADASQQHTLCDTDQTRVGEFGLLGSQHASGSDQNTELWQGGQDNTMACVHCGQQVFANDATCHFCGKEKQAQATGGERNPNRSTRVEDRYPQGVPNPTDFPAIADPRGPGWAAIFDNCLKFRLGPIVFCTVFGLWFASTSLGAAISGSLEFSSVTDFLCFGLYVCAFVGYLLGYVCHFAIRMISALFAYPLSPAAHVMAIALIVGAALPISLSFLVRFTGGQPDLGRQLIWFSAEVAWAVMGSWLIGGWVCASHKVESYPLWNRIGFRGAVTGLAVAPLLCLVFLSYSNTLQRGMDEIKVTTPVAFFNEGRSHASKGQHYKAIRYYTEAIRLDPKDAITYLNRGVSYAATREYDKAILDYNEASRLDPKMAVPYYCRGLCFAQKGNTEAAIADYTEALRLDPTSPDFYKQRAMAYRASGDVEKAASDERRSKELSK